MWYKAKRSQHLFYDKVIFMFAMALKNINR